MKRIFKSKSDLLRLNFCRFKGVDTPDMPTAPASAPPPSSPTKETARDVQQAKADEKQREKRKQGYQSTVLNGSEGLGGSVQGQQKTLLGG